MRSKEEIMKELGKMNSAEFPSVASANEYLFLEVLCDIRDQLTKLNQKKIEKAVLELVSGGK